MKKERLKISVNPSTIFMLAAIFITRSYIALAAILAALLHELSHLTAAKICNIPLKELKLGIFGASIIPKASLCSYKKEIILALSGPISNVASALLLFFFFGNKNEILTYFISASLFLGILNFLPIYEFDGGRVLFCMISLHHSPETALKTLKALSFIIIFSLWCLSVYLSLKLSASISLFVFSLALFAKIFLSQKDSLY